MRGDGSENRHPTLADAKDSVLVVIDPQVKLVNMIRERESAFHEALLAAGRRRLLVTGVETHICVCRTVLDGLQRGFTVHVVADAVGSRRSIDHEIALRRMEQAGAVVTTAEAAMYEGAERADDDKFKELLNLVK